MSLHRFEFHDQPAVAFSDAVLGTSYTCWIELAADRVASRRVLTGGPGT